jgi:hypothetical protein
LAAVCDKNAVFKSFAFGKKLREKKILETTSL